MFSGLLCLGWGQLKSEILREAAGKFLNPQGRATREAPPALAGFMPLLNGGALLALMLH